MVLTPILSQRIVTVALSYLGMPFDWHTFNCVHFVRKVYGNVGIILPPLERYELPPREFHLSASEFLAMPLGHSVFFKRTASPAKRYWTHLAIIVGPDELIHCTRHLGNGVAVTPKAQFLETYALAPYAPE